MMQNWRDKMTAADDPRSDELKFYLYSAIVRIIGGTRTRDTKFYLSSVKFYLLFIIIQ